MIHDSITATLLGVVEGLTEFLPVSSTGHLVLVGHWLGFEGPEASLFEVFIQLGAILAVVVVSFNRFMGLLDFRSSDPLKGWNGCFRLALTTLPALVAGALLHGAIKAHLFTPQTVMVGFAVGGVAILLVERWIRGRPARSLEDMTLPQALAIGFFQCLALWPGMSRSACTILGGMTLGLKRDAAVRYSFLAAVPVMVAAVGYDLWKGRELLGREDAPLFAIGFVVSFVSALLAIRFFLRLLAAWDLKPFGYYRIAVAVAGLMWFWFKGG